MKRFISILFAFIICVTLCVPALAANDGFVFDLSGVSIGENDLAVLNDTARKLDNDYGVELLFFITDNLGSNATTSVFAKAEYEKRVSADKAGACFTYYIKENKMYFYVSESAEGVINEAVKNKIYELFNESKTYNDAAASYYKYLGEVLKQSGGISVVTTAAESDKTTEKREIPEKRLLPYMVDNAAVLTAEQRAELNKKLKEYSEKCECEIAIATVKTTEGQDIENFSMDFYDYNGFGYGKNKDGLILVLSMDGRDWCAVGTGVGEKIFTSSVTNEMVSDISQYLKNDDFYTAFNKFADDFVVRYENHGKLSIVWIPVSVIIGFVVAYLVMKMATKNLKSVEAKTNAKEYVVPGSLMLTASSDNFLYTNVTRTARPKQNSSSGSSIGSSGTSHSVSSGKF